MEMSNPDYKSAWERYGKPLSDHRPVWAVLEFPVTSNQAATAAEKLGYTKVKHLSAGITGWMQAGEKMEKAKADKPRG